MNAVAELRRSYAPGFLRPVWAEVDLGALRHNVRLLAGLMAPAQLCAVVKADAYGHGAVPVARAALEAGATWLAVALVEEGAALREAGISAPVLLLSEPPPEAMSEAVHLGLTPTLYTHEGVSAVAAAAESARGPVRVHVKVDTGMHRVGADPSELMAIVGRVLGADRLELQGLWTHLAVADGTSDPDLEYTRSQLELFDRIIREVTRSGARPALLHAANSAGAIAYPASRLDMVRSGISIYGYPPSSQMGDAVAVALGQGMLRPVLSLHARVSMVRELDAGERPSYGRRAALGERSVVATVPIGYADGLPRRYFTEGGTVLVGGRKCPLAGTVTMDQIMVDLGAGAKVAVGDEVVLIGRQGLEELTAEDWAEVLGTISYEVLCCIGPRVPRVVEDRT